MAGPISGPYEILKFLLGTILSLSAMASSNSSLPIPSRATVSITGTFNFSESFLESIFIPLLFATSTIFKTIIRGKPNSSN